MGANVWRESQEWPPEMRARGAFFLTSAGTANSLDGDGVCWNARCPAAPRLRHIRLRPARSRPDPRRRGLLQSEDLSRGGRWTSVQSKRRKDVLVYTTAPLRQDMEVTGPVRSRALRFDDCDGHGFHSEAGRCLPRRATRATLTDGMLRLRYRNSLEKPELVKPGEVYRVTIDAGVTGNVFLKGHRIRVEISSSNFPRFDRNPNSGGTVADEMKLFKATQTVYHDRDRPSQVVLMTMPADRRGQREVPLSRSSG